MESCLASLVSGYGRPVTAKPLGPRDLTRRAVLVGAVALAVSPVLGCEVMEKPANDPPGGPNPAPSIPSDRSGALDPATKAVVNDALTAVVGHRVWVEAVGVAYPGRFGPRSQRVVAMHRAHEAFLAGLLGTDTATSALPSPVPSTRQGAEQAVVGTFDTLIAHLADLAVAAPEPGLARALASICAATAQMAASAGWNLPTPITALTTAPGRLAQPEYAAIQRVLAREHANLWWYGVLGARTSSSRTPGLLALINQGYVAHRAQRDQLDAFLRTQRALPVAAEPAYPIPWPTRSPSQRARAAAQIDHDAAATYSWLVAQIQVVDGSAPGAQVRLWAITALRNAAIRELVAQGTPENFPGADDFADR